MHGCQVFRHCQGNAVGVTRAVRAVLWQRPRLFKLYFKFGPIDSMKRGHQDLRGFSFGAGGDGPEVGFRYCFKGQEASVLSNKIQDRAFTRAVIP